MKVSIYSFLFLFLYLGTAMSEVSQVDCFKGKTTKKITPVLNFRQVSSLLKPVAESMESDSVVDLIYSYYEEENIGKQATLLAEIQSLFETATINPNSEDFDGGSLLFNIGLNDREIEKEKVYNIVKAILNFSGEEAVELNIIDPLWKSAPLHQAAVSINGKVAAAFLSYKKDKGHSANPYLLDRSMPDTFMGRLPNPIKKSDYKHYYDFFVEVHKVEPKLLNLPLMSLKGSITFLSKIEAAAEVEFSIDKTSDIRNGLLLPIIKLGMKNKANKISAEEWK